MKPSITTSSLFTLLAWTLISFTPTQSDDHNSEGTTDTLKSNLSLYGEYIYKRENCNNCHSLNISDNKTKISLDGLAGKYPVSWHYVHLTDPTLVAPVSKMPSYAILSINTFDRDAVEKHCSNLSKRNWKKLTAEANVIKNELNKFGINTTSNTEIIALISFLDHIPQSAECKQLRTKEIEKANREKAVNDSIWAASENVLVKTINDPESIGLGRTVFKRNCTPCHGYNAEGVVGPNLTDEYWLHGSKDNNIVTTIVNGIPDKGMIAWKNRLTPDEIGQLVAYIKSTKGSNPANAKAGQGTKE